MKSKKNDDLNFVPLNIKEPLKPGSSKFPLVMNIEGISITHSASNLFLGFPNIGQPTPLQSMDVIAKEKEKSAPLTPYPNNIPNVEPGTSGLKNTYSETSPESPIPFVVDTSDEDLYSYNETRLNSDYLDNVVDHLDILKNFDLSIDELRGKDNSCTVDEIFKDIEENNSGIIATMKAYRIPYPIAKLLIKKIIKMSIECDKR